MPKMKLQATSSDFLRRFSFLNRVIINEQLQVSSFEANISWNPTPNAEDITHLGRESSARINKWKTLTSVWFPKQGTPVVEATVLLNPI